VPVAPNVPRDAVTTRLEKVLRRTLLPDPGQRPADGTALARELMLCLNPRAWDLVHDLQSGWRDFARRFPIWALFPVNLPPFLLAGWFNLWFNMTYFVPELREINPQMEQAFWAATGPVNGILYPLGTILVVAFAWPVARAIQRLNRGETLEANALAAARRRALVLGHGVAAVGIVLWLVAGLAFPLWIHFRTADFPATGYLRFFLSMLVCGIISCCLPFLATTWLSVRVFIPALLANSAPDAAEQRRLIALGSQAGIYLFASPVAPLGALLLVTFSEHDARQATIILICVAIAGFAAAYLTWQRIRADLAALSVVARPPDMIGTATDTVDTF
jgi:hypothetical protein